MGVCGLQGLGVTSSKKAACIAGGAAGAAGVWGYSGWQCSIGLTASALTLFFADADARRSHRLTMLVRRDVDHVELGIALNMEYLGKEIIIQESADVLFRHLDQSDCMLHPDQFRRAVESLCHECAACSGHW